MISHEPRQVFTWTGLGSPIPIVNSIIAAGFLSRRIEEIWELSSIAVVGNPPLDVRGSK
jgi:hypothetical protein